VHRTRTPRQESRITAIETRYAGYRFRSRLEARWYVFFEVLGVQAEYEEQGFTVPGRSANTRTYYLPDFYLPQHGLYYEVKPSHPEQVDLDGVTRWEDFAHEVVTAWDHSRTVMSVGEIPNADAVDQSGPPRPEKHYEAGIYMLGFTVLAWCACPTGKHFDVQVDGRGGNIPCGCERIIDERRYQTGDDPRILAAYRAARAARFEHGEVA